MSKDKLTHNEKDLVLEALFYYRDETTQPNEEICGLIGTKKKTINRAISKIERNFL